MKHVHKHGNVTVTIETDELPEVPSYGKVSLEKHKLFEIVRLLEKNNQKCAAVIMIRDYCNCELRDALSLCNDIVKFGY